MTPHDTAAALQVDALADLHDAVDRIGLLRIERHIDCADEDAEKRARADLDRAITAHVEAEVARRLAVAPDVEDAIAELAGCSATSTACDEIRAAIAADKARAVEAAISPAVHELRNALPPVRHHAQRIEPGDRREAILRGVDRALAVADELAAVLDGGAAVKARPTPDEARRLVEALHLDLLATADTVAALHGAIGTGLRNHCVAAADKLRLTADTARAALLRALGVEA